MPDRDAQQHYWDSNLDAHNLGGAASITGESLSRELKFSNVPDIQDMIHHSAPQPGKRILELGPGLGANAVLLSREGATVIALDISQERLVALRQRTSQLAKSATGNIIPVRASAEALPFKPGVLDGACCRAVLIHTDLPASISEINQALKPGAPVAFSEPMAHNPFVRLYRATLAPKEWRTITTYFDMPQIASTSAPFANPDVRHYYGFGFLAFVFQYALACPALFYSSLAVFRTLDNFLFRYFPRLKHLAWFVLITGYKRKP